MSAEHDNHGQTPAAWTAVIIMILAFLVGGIGLIIANFVVFWIGVALFFIGIVVGKVMAMAGLGKAPAHAEAAGIEPTPVEPAPAEPAATQGDS